LQAGETFLIQGGTSGIGVTAIQVAKAFGATVIATAGSDDKCQACLDLGADHAINYKTMDFVAEIKRLTSDASQATASMASSSAASGSSFMSNAPVSGVDVILDMVAGDYVKREIECMNEDGRLVIIAVQGGVKAEVNAGLVLRRRLTITGSTLRPRSVAFKADIAASLKARVWPLLANKTIKPVLFKTFPAADASKAHTLMESNQHIGKIVLTW
jgi:NADPH:quinone reductase-like Zn-dependent oxidoreductase